MDRTGATATIERRVQRIIFCHEHARRILELQANSTKDERESFAEWVRIALEYGPKTNACDIYITLIRTFMYYFEKCNPCKGVGMTAEGHGVCDECQGRGVVLKKQEIPNKLERAIKAFTEANGATASWLAQLTGLPKFQAYYGGRGWGKTQHMHMVLKNMVTAGFDVSNLRIIKNGKALTIDEYFKSLENDIH